MPATPTIPLCRLPQKIKTAFGSNLAQDRLYLDKTKHHIWVSDCQMRYYKTFSQDKYLLPNFGPLSFQNICGNHARCPRDTINQFKSSLLPHRTASTMLAEAKSRITRQGQSKCHWQWKKGGIRLVKVWDLRLRLRWKGIGKWRSQNRPGCVVLLLSCILGWIIRTLWQTLAVSGRKTWPCGEECLEWDPTLPPGWGLVKSGGRPRSTRSVTILSGEESSLRLEP